MKHNQPTRLPKTHKLSWCLMFPITAITVLICGIIRPREGGMGYWWSLAKLNHEEGWDL